MPTVFHLERDLQQLHLSLGARGVPDGNENRYPLTVLNILLGGGMSSRLFQSVREEAGLAYSVYSVQDVFRDCGMVSIHMAVSPERGREALARTRDELRRLVAEGPNEEEVESAKSQYRGTVLMDHESVSSRMVHLARHDPITDLPNRVAFNEHLTRVFSEASAGHGSFGTGPDSPFTRRRTRTAPACRTTCPCSASTSGSTPTTCTTRTDGPTT